KSAPQRKADKRLTFEVRSLAWPKVFELLSDMTGLPGVMTSHKPPAGSLDIVAPGKAYSVPQAMDLINRALAQHKLLLLRREGEFVLVSAGQIDPQLVPRIELTDLQQRGDTEVVSLNIQLRG